MHIVWGFQEHFQVWMGLNKVFQGQEETVITFAPFRHEYNQVCSRVFWRGGMNIGRCAGCTSVAGA